MAIAFNGTTSKLEHATAAGFDADTLTLLYWCFVTGAGEGVGGIVFALPETGGTTFVFRQAAGNQRFRSDRSVTNGNWDFSVPENQWSAVAIAYDRSLASNDPAVRVDFASASVSEISGPPDGTPEALTTGYCVGNQSNQSRTFEGRLAHVQFFNRILSAGECDQALRRPGSIRSGLVLWLPMFDATYLPDLAGSGNTPTGTDLASGAGPYVQPGFGLDDDFMPYVTAAAARRGDLLLLGCGA